jgi:Acetyl xylan esterase (AXE1)/RTX calcium-binding nonapeptide repeat (4 copies)
VARARVAGTIAGLWLLVAAAPAAGEITDVFDGQVSCATQGDGTRFCGGANTLVPTFDDQLLDVNVALPPEPAAGPDGPYPMVMVFHGYGGSELGLSALRRWTGQGYAAFSMTDRGFGPCGVNPTPPRCVDGGWVRLMDTRYEVRDAQHLAGILVDEGVADPEAIAATGGSYGGGLSMALAALRNRVMLPNGEYEPWTTPEGEPISLVAAAPEVPWTDLAYALTPNGRTLDYVADAPYFGPDGDARIGVMKKTYVDGLYAGGDVTGYYAPPLMDPDADLTTWFARLNAGEPYEETPEVAEIVDEITSHHSSYYIDHSIAPAPLLISSGWTDDLVPADEAIRFYNRTRAEHPGADVSLFFLDYGHPRAQGKDADEALLAAAQDEFLAHHLTGAEDPGAGVTTLTQTCPSSAPSQGPFTAPDWSEIAPGEVRVDGAASQTIAPVAPPTDAERGAAYNPIGGGGACATAPGSDQQGAASYRADPAPAGGYTLMGSPTVIADFSSVGPTSQVAARLLDVAPNGQATLVARGLWRPAVGSGPFREVFQLHPNGWRFEEGHVAKLELLPSDAPYGRPSNGQQEVTVENLELRLPVLEEPGKGMVVEPLPKVVPDGYELAPGFGEARTPHCHGREATIVGDRRRNVLTGTRRADVILARGGNDVIKARKGRDRICAGLGDDRIRTGPGRDRVWPGRGRDRVDGERGR